MAVQVHYDQDCKMSITGVECNCGCEHRAIDKDIYIGGGAVVYKQAIHLVDKMYISEIDAEFEADTFFPAFDENLFTKEIDSFHDGEIPYTYVSYTRK